MVIFTGMAPLYPVACEQFIGAKNLPPSASRVKSDFITIKKLGWEIFGCLLCLVTLFLSLLGCVFVRVDMYRVVKINFCYLVEHYLRYSCTYIVVTIFAQS